MLERRRDLLKAAAAAHIEQPSAETRSALCSAIEGVLRTCDVSGEPSPAQCDGVVLLQTEDRGGSVFEFLGYSWLVTSQQATPLRARFRTKKGQLEFEIRFGVSELCMPSEKIDKLVQCGDFPPRSADWVAVLQG